MFCFFCWHHYWPAVMLHICLKKHGIFLPCSFCEKGDYQAMKYKRLVEYRLLVDLVTWLSWHCFWLWCGCGGLRKIKGNIRLWELSSIIANLAQSLKPNLFVKCKNMFKENMYKLFLTTIIWFNHDFFDSWVYLYFFTSGKKKHRDQIEHTNIFPGVKTIPFITSLFK